MVLTAMHHRYTFVMHHRYILEAEMRIRDISPFALRIPVDVKRQVDEQAKLNRRSMNAEIGVLIEEALSARAKRTAA